MTTENQIPAYHQQVIGKFPANVWVKPYNSSSCNDHQIFSDLYEWGLVQRKIVPHYNGKQHIGSSVYFMYS